MPSTRTTSILTCSSSDPQAYASAQNRSIIAFSSRTGTADERAVVNTWTRTGDFYVRVRGRNGVFSLASPFTINVSIQPGLCQNLDTALVPGSLPATAGNFHTIILVDPTRMTGSPADINAMLAKLAQLAARPEVQGVVVNVSQDARVAAANLQADQKVECPEAKNLVADATKQIVQRYQALNPLEYVVIVGNDNAIPFFRTPDQASLASEINYIPPVFNDTQSQSSLRLGYVLTQDPYGSDVEISFKNHTIPVPDLAVGRLVETPGEVMHMVDAYLATNGGVVPTPTSAFVSGYDFLTDAAEAVQAELESGIGQPASTLIAPRDAVAAGSAGLDRRTAQDAVPGQPPRPHLPRRPLQRSHRTGRRLHNPHDHAGRALIHRGPGKCDHLQRGLSFGLQHRQHRCGTQCHA